MHQSIPAPAIGPLRQRLIDDMNMRRFLRETQRNYIRDVGAARRSCGARLILLRRMTCAGFRLNSVMRRADAEHEQQRIDIAFLLHVKLRPMGTHLGMRTNAR